MMIKGKRVSHRRTHPTSRLLLIRKVLGKMAPFLRRDTDGRQAKKNPLLAKYKPSIDITLQSNLKTRFNGRVFGINGGRRRR